MKQSDIVYWLWRMTDVTGAEFAGICYRLFLICEKRGVYFKLLTQNIVGGSRIKEQMKNVIKIEFKYFSFIFVFYNQCTGLAYRCIPAVRNVKRHRRKSLRKLRFQFQISLQFSDGIL
jgi:hypothetical protein